jgi:hypothetical protein
MHRESARLAGATWGGGENKIALMEKPSDFRIARGQKRQKRRWVEPVTAVLMALPH